MIWQFIIKTSACRKIISFCCCCCCDGGSSNCSETVLIRAHKQHRYNEKYERNTKWNIVNNTLNATRKKISLAKEKKTPRCSYIEFGARLCNTSKSTFCRINCNEVWTDTMKWRKGHDKERRKIKSVNFLIDAF